MANHELSFFQEKNTPPLSAGGSVTLPACHEPISNGGTGGNTDSPISATAAAVEMALEMAPLASALGDSPLNNIDPTLGFGISPSEGPEQNTGSPGGGWSVPLDALSGTGGDTDSPISATAAAVDITVDMGALMSAQVDQTLGFEISLSDGLEQNTSSPGGSVDPNQTNWIRWLVPLGVTVNLPNLSMNGIRQLVLLAGANFSANTLVAVNYLYGQAQEAHERNWRAELIASVGVAVSVFTLLSSFRFASDPERWSNWITELSRLNAAMIGVGPFAFYWMSNRGTEN